MRISALGIIGNGSRSDATDNIRGIQTSGLGDLNSLALFLFQDINLGREIIGGNRRQTGRPVLTASSQRQAHTAIGLAPVTRIIRNHFIEHCAIQMPWSSALINA